MGFFLLRVERWCDRTLCTLEESLSFHCWKSGVSHLKHLKRNTRIFNRFTEADLTPVKKSGKMGLFDYRKQQLMVDTEYSDMFMDETNQMVYLCKPEKNLVETIT